MRALSAPASVDDQVDRQTDFLWARQDSNLGHTDYESERRGYRSPPVTTDRWISRAFAAAR